MNKCECEVCKCKMCGVRLQHRGCHTLFMESRIPEYKKRCNPCNQKLKYLHKREDTYISKYDYVGYRNQTYK
jgi:hypothetical protein